MRALVAVVLFLLTGCPSEPELPPALLVVGAQTLDFGSVPINRSFTRRLDVENRGEAPLQITAISVDQPFEAFPSMATIGAGDSLEMRVRFNPMNEGEFSGALSFESNDANGSTVSVALLGSAFCSGVGCPMIVDAGSPDAGNDDAGPADAGTTDAADSGATDAQPGDADAGVTDAADAGTPDTGPPDTGPPGAPGLGAFYRFENMNGALIDGSGNGNHGTPAAAGMMRGIPGKIGNAVRFEGSVGNFIVPTDNTLDPVGGLTIEMFINPEVTGMQTILSRGRNTTQNAILISTSCHNVQVSFSRTGMAGAATANTNCNSFVPNQWVHIAIVNDGLFLTVYLDGNPVAQNMGGFLGPSIDPVFIGRKDPGVEPFTGGVDELRWWTVPRTQAEVCGSAGGTLQGNSCLIP